MPGKRSRRNKAQKFFCPHCGERLWRVGSQKHHLVYTEAKDIQTQLNVSAKKAKFIAATGPSMDSRSWIEEFFCGEHGKMWLLLKRDNDGAIHSVLAKSPDWQKATGVVDPDCPNPSVSEYTRRMSRGNMKR